MLVSDKVTSTFPRIVALDSSAGLVRLTIDSGLGAFFAYDSRRGDILRKSLDRVLRTSGGEVIVAVTDGAIVGYLLIAPVAGDQSLGQARDPWVFDVVIEVARGHRGRGVARALFERAFSRPAVESRIYVATAYAWSWDVEGTGVDAATYGQRLLRLFERFGFHHEWTDEVSLSMAVFNFVAVRIGRRVSADLVRRFRASVMGYQPREATPVRVRDLGTGWVQHAKVE